MLDQTAPVYAAIDVGSNTIHIVVARCSCDDLDILADEVELVRIGESVTATGEISPPKCEATIAVLQQYKALAEHHGARAILVVATEAIRRASNNVEFTAAVQQETGLQVVLVDGMVEATLTFMGATYPLKHEAHAPRQAAVMDLGGGSIELVTATDGQITWRTSLPLGSGWLHDRYLTSNPPTLDELEFARTFLTTFMQGIHLKRAPSVLIATGGSANSLLYLAHRAFGVDLVQARLSYDDLTRCEGLLWALPAEEIAQRYQQPLGRALILPAGAAIIRAMMNHFHLTEIRISSHGIREGVLLAYACYGDEWLTRIQEQVAESAAGGTLQADRSVGEDSSEANFVQVGRHLILEYAHKVLSWRDAVLRNDDPEAVHKMRVATRRLRAALDAYASICDRRALRKGYRRVKKLAKALGNARDTDVMILHLQEQLEEVNSDEQAGIRWLIARLQAYRQLQQGVLEDVLQRLDEDELLEQLMSSLPEGS